MICISLHFLALPEIICKCLCIHMIFFFFFLARKSPYQLLWGLLEAQGEGLVCVWLRYGNPGTPGCCSRTLQSSYRRREHCAKIQRYGKQVCMIDGGAP